MDYEGPINSIMEAIAETALVGCTDDPAKCICRGCGWWLSGWDSWHRCTVHPDTGHPEYD